MLLIASPMNFGSLPGDVRIFTDFCVFILADFGLVWTWDLFWYSPDFYYLVITGFFILLFCFGCSYFLEISSYLNFFKDGDGLFWCKGEYFLSFSLVDLSLLGFDLTHLQWQLQHYFLYCFSSFLKAKSCSFQVRI